MGEEIQKDEEPILEVMITLQELREKTKIIRTDDEVKRGTESLQGTKKTQKLLVEPQPSSFRRVIEKKKGKTQPKKAKIR